LADRVDNTDELADDGAFEDCEIESDEDVGNESNQVIDLD
jgi:hypothetical protein